MDGNILVEQLKIWIETWRACHPEVPEGILQGSDLYMFVDGLQNEIRTQIEDFGFNTIGNDAGLILYSGIGYKDVYNYCEASGGKNYMISQTLSTFLWDDRIRDAVAQREYETFSVNNIST